MRILSELPKTLVLLLQPPDYTQYENIPDRGFICDFFVTQGCECLFKGPGSKRRLQLILKGYTKAYKRLARQFTRQDFGVVVMPSLLGLPPKERRGYKQVPSKNSYSHDCIHYNGRTQSMVRKFIKSYTSAVCFS